MPICTSDKNTPAHPPPSQTPLPEQFSDNSKFVARQNKLWKEHHSANEPQEIRCKFVNNHPDPQYDERIKGLVQKWVKEWELYAFIYFRFVGKTEAAHIRIEFADDNTASSAIGTDAITLRANSKEKTIEELMQSLIPSMHFGDFSRDPKKMPEDLPDDQIHEVGKDCARTTVLHEFGHALGLYHEHANPKALFVLSAGMLENHNNQPVKGSAGDKVNVSAFDLWSIMRYPLGEKAVDWDKSRAATGMNSQEWLKYKKDLRIRPIRLSEGDKVWAITAYSGKSHPELDAARAKWAGTIEG